MMGVTRRFEEMWRRGLALCLCLGLFSLALISVADGSSEAEYVSIKEVNNFEPDNILKILHNGARIQGDNEFKFPDDLNKLDGQQYSQASDFFDSEEGQYYAGALSGAVFMSIWLVIWFILLCTSSCCKTMWPCCNDPCITVLLVFAVVGSTIGWFYSISGNTEFQKGLSQMTESGDDITLKLDSAVDEVDRIIAIEQNLNNAVLNANASCAIMIQAFEDAGGDVPEEVSTDGITTGGQFKAAVEGPKSSMEESSDLVQKCIDIITPVLEVINPVYIAFTATIISLLGIFAITTTFKVLSERGMLNCEENIVARFNKCINSCGVWLLFTIGFIIVVTVWILATIMAPIATVGSDICNPDFSTNLLLSLSPLVLSADASNEEELNILDLCELDKLGVDKNNLAELDSLTDEQKASNLMCHYAKCQGDNFVLLQLGIETNDAGAIADVVNTLVTIAEKTIKVIVDFIESQDVENADQSVQDAVDGCVKDIGEISDNIETVRDALLEVGQFLNCRKVTPIYRRLVDDQFCNGVVSGIGIIYVTWTTGAAGMMVAMYLFLLLDPNREIAIREGQREFVVVGPPPGSADGAPGRKDSAKSGYTVLSRLSFRSGLTRFTGHSGNGRSDSGAGVGNPDSPVLVAETVQERPVASNTAQQQAKLKKDKYFDTSDDFRETPMF